MSARRALECWHRMAHANSAGKQSFRRPWYWLAVLALVAAAASLLIVGNARARYAQEQRNFASSQELRLQRVEQRVDEYFAQAIALASFGSHTLGSSRGNVALTRLLTVAMIRSSHRPDIIGAGVAYVPYAFDPRFRLVYAYCFASARTAELFEGNHAPPGNEYTQFAWFQRALREPARTAFTGPYTHGVSYISTEKAISVGSRVVGVVVVDTLTALFKRLMRMPLASGDVAWIESSKRGHELLATAPIPAGYRVDRRMMLRYTHAYVHLSTDATPLRTTARSLISSALGLIIAIWFVAVLAAVGVLQRWRAQEREGALEAVQRRLEDEIALQKTVEAELRKAAFTDTLTGLPNRAAFLDFAQSVLSSERRDRYTIFFIDLDRFNIVNETLGHLAGDDLLRSIGARLRTVVEPTDLIARLGGDEFVIVASIESRSFTEAAALLLAHLSDPIIIKGRSIYPEASMGVVAVDDSYANPEELLRDADIAMYEAKRRGRARFVIFDAAMRRRIAQDSQLEEELRRAIEHGELEPHYQPIYSLDAQRIVGFEALVRWHRQDGTVALASEFMGFAEAHGFVEAIDGLVFRAVCSHGKAIFDLFPGASIAVNVSASEIASTAYVENTETLLRRHGLPPERLKLEITETAMMTSSDAANRTMQRLRDLGLEFALDDFGTGYSSLAYLQRLPIRGLKIDRSFIEPLPGDPRALEIVRSIVLLARSFGLSVTAEGVESAEQVELLRELGVDFAQGFFFSAAVTIAALGSLVPTEQEGPSPAAEMNSP